MTGMDLIQLFSFSKDVVEVIKAVRGHFADKNLEILAGEMVTANVDWSVLGSSEHSQRVTARILEIVASESDIKKITRWKSALVSLATGAVTLDVAESYLEILRGLSTLDLIVLTVGQTSSPHHDGEPMEAYKERVFYSRFPGTPRAPINISINKLAAMGLLDNEASWDGGMVGFPNATGKEFLRFVDDNYVKPF